MSEYERPAADRAALSLARGLHRVGAAYPFLRRPIEEMERVPDVSLSGLATDGLRLFYDPRGAHDPAAVEHLLIHCLYRHLPPPDAAIRPLWDLACDLSAEYLRAEWFPGKGSRLTQLQIRDALPEDVDPRVAGAVYGALKDLFEDALDDLLGQYRLDDHRYWYAPFEAVPPPQRDGARPDFGGNRRAAPLRPEFDRPDAYREWVRRRMAGLWPRGDELPGGASITGRYGLAPGSREEKMRLREEARYDFAPYLRRLTTTEEELKIDMGSFDYIPYCYGLTRYGNMPLIEPLEYSERNRVEQLVIAIDTSGSCSSALVARFLAEIEGILMQRDAFFDRMDVHIVQCDSAVQSHVEIHSREAWRAYRRGLTIKGRSGTDFRPVFALVDRLRASGKLEKLKGLLYFTDGDGAYPQKKTPYETAFVFSTRKALGYKFPDWIVPLCLERRGEGPYPIQGAEA